MPSRTGPDARRFGLRHRRGAPAAAIGSVALLGVWLAWMDRALALGWAAVDSAEWPLAEATDRGLSPDVARGPRFRSHGSPLPHIGTAPPQDLAPEADAYVALVGDDG